MKAHVNKAPDFSTVHIWQDAKEQFLREQLYIGESLIYLLFYRWHLIMF